MKTTSDRAIARSPATPRQLAVAVGISISLVAVFTVTMPFARHPTAHTEILLPAYAAAAFVLEIVTAGFLFALYGTRRAPGLLVLACGYLFSALLVPPWVLTFPGVFTAFGLDFGPQATASLAACRRLGFPLFVLAYALVPEGGPRGLSLRNAGPLSVLVICVGAWLLVGVILTHNDKLPAFMVNDRQVGFLWRVIPPMALLLYLIDITLLLRRRRSLLDIWVCLVLFSLVIDILLISYLGGAIRLSVGWWAGRLYGLAAASLVLMLLLSETTALYTRLARTRAAERRARQNRLTAMEALSGAIAHEINQPLASMVTNADAALRWLARPEPRVDRVEAALRRIVDDGHRANKVVTGIRTMFTKGTQERAELDLNALVAQAVEAATPEARQENIDLFVETDPSMTPVIGNAVQLDHVMRNLLDNAFDAIRMESERPRRIVVRTRGDRPDAQLGEVQVSIADTGGGIAGEVADRLFEPFVSTKPGGMGMGLMFCRAVVESHGGRLWPTPNAPRGTIFHFSLPTLIFPAADAGAHVTSGEEPK